MRSYAINNEKKLLKCDKMRHINPHYEIRPVSARPAWDEKL